MSNELVNKVKEELPSQELLYDLSDFFKVMGDSTRVRILWALDNQELCVGDLAAVLNMTKSAVSHQLKILKLSKLVKFNKLGKNVFYSLDDHHVKIVLEKALEHVSEGV